MFSCLFLWVQVQYSKHLGQGHNVLFLQRTHVASMYQIFFPKIKWKHIILCIYHPFDENFQFERHSMLISCTTLIWHNVFQCLEKLMLKHQITCRYQ